MLAELIGGAQGGMMGALASHPFDVCSVAVMRGEAANGLQALLKRIKTEGVLGLWRGVPMNAVFNIVNKSVYFLMYAVYTSLYKQRFNRTTVASGARELFPSLAPPSFCGTLWPHFPLHFPISPRISLGFRAF